MIPELTTTGFLPVGRYPCSFSELHERFVDDYSNSDTRSEIWEEFQSFLEQLKNIIPICAVWIGGSYISGKTNPNDIDLLLIIDRDKIKEKVFSEPQNAFLWACTQGHSGWNQLGIPFRIDTYTVWWQAVPNGIPDESVDYYKGRGYWDDFWQRCRSGAKTDRYIRDDSFPRRGYLEVMIDGYE